MKITTDKRLNPILRAEVASLRECMVVQADKNILPKRFRVRPSKVSPTMTITDTTTKRKTIVPLFAYGTVRKTLSELFS